MKSDCKNINEDFQIGDIVTLFTNLHKLFPFGITAYYRIDSFAKISQSDEYAVLHSLDPQYVNQIVPIRDLRIVEPERLL